jgi:hypothetical protein
MSQVKVSKKQFEELEALRARQLDQIQGAGEEKRDVGAEVWDTAKQVGKWYIGANLVVLVVLVIPAIIAVICGLCWIFSQVGHQAAMTNAWMDQVHQTYGR